MHFNSPMCATTCKNTKVQPCISQTLFFQAKCPHQIIMSPLGGWAWLTAPCTKCSRIELFWASNRPLTNHMLQACNCTPSHYQQSDLLSGRLWISNHKGGNLQTIIQITGYSTVLHITTWSKFKCRAIKPRST